MKAKALIELLKTVPGDLEILLPGYDGGFNSQIVLNKPEKFTGNYYVQENLGDHERTIRAIRDQDTAKKQFTGAVLVGVKQFKSQG